MVDLDLIDRKILSALMQDATLPIGQIADRVGLSQTPCWKRIQKLEASGVIRKRVALVNPSAIGFGLIVFVALKAPDHGAEWRTEFQRVLDTLPEVMDAYRMAGEMDYLLRVAVPDMAAFDAFYRRLTDAIAVKDVTSHFAMEHLTERSVFPLDTRNR